MNKSHILWLRLSLIAGAIASGVADMDGVAMFMAMALILTFYFLED